MNLSVVIPTKNRAELLKKALLSIVAQSLPQNQFELIIIDNGSTDHTQEIIKEFTLKIKNLKNIYNETPGLHVGRHEGLNNSSYEILVYLDDDVELFPKHLENIVESFKNNEVVLIGGKNLPKFESEPPLWLQEMWKEKKCINQLSILDFGNDIKYIDPNFVWGCNFSIRKSILIEAGGFHPDAMPQELIKYRGDGETSVSNFIKESHYKAIYHPDISVYHFVPNNRMTEEYFCKRMFNQGISDSYTILRKYQKFSNLKDRENKKIKNSISLDEKMYNAYLDGYIYHQQECKNDLKLMEWVLKDRYYD